MDHARESSSHRVYDNQLGTETNLPAYLSDAYHQISRDIRPRMCSAETTRPTVTSSPEILYLELLELTPDIFLNPLWSEPKFQTACLAFRTIRGLVVSIFLECL